MKAADNRSVWIRWWALSGEEPFRLFMPLGTLAALLGALVWPFSILGWWWAPCSPLEVHWRLMSEGFVGLFIIGFFGTAAPRLLSVPALTPTERNVLAMLAVAFFGALVAGWLVGADLFFLLLLLALIAMLVGRSPLRGDWPPPGFVLVGISLVGTTAALCVIFFSHLAPMPSWVPRLGRAWLAEVWPLLPILGVGAFFFPRLAKKPSRHDFPESEALPRGWKRRMWESLGLGALVLAGFLAEHLLGMVRLGVGLRATAVLVFLLREFPPAYWVKVRGGSGLTTMIGLVGIALGLALRVGWPESGTSGAHWVYLGGFALVIFGVASRVLFGHSGQASLMHRIQPASLALIGGLVTAAALRFTLAFGAEFVWWGYFGAGMIGAGAVVIWAMRFLPGVLRPDED